MVFLKSINKTKILFIVFVVFILACALSFAKNSLDLKLEKAIQKYILSIDPELISEQITIKFSYPQILIDAYHKNDNIDFNVSKEFKISKITSKMLIPVSIVEKAVNFGNVNVWVDLEIYKTIIVAQKNITKGRIISSEDLKITKKEISSLNYNYFDEFNDIVGKVAKNNIKEGSIVYDWMVKISPFISKGKSIKIVSRLQNILIETFGFALEDGQLGETIKVRRNDSKEVLNATIVSSEVVEVKN